MPSTTRACIRSILALAAALVAVVTLTLSSGAAFAQAGYPPTPPGITPPSFGQPTQQHFEILRQQDQQRRDFDAVQGRQQQLQQQNLQTIRRQQRDQQRALDAMRRESRDAEARAAASGQVQGRVARRPLTEEERRRIDSATRRRTSPLPSIMIEDSPRR